MFASLKGMLLFTVVALIGTGWSLVKPFLTERDKKIVFTVLGCQVRLFAQFVAWIGSRGAYLWLCAVRCFVCIVVTHHHLTLCSSTHSMF
jgi:hypothetical protein